MRRDNRHIMAKDNRISPAPATVMRKTGTVKEHFTIPMLFKNRATSGLMMKLHKIRPAMEERTTAGIKLRAVCKISCLVVNPRAFRIP